VRDDQFEHDELGLLHQYHDLEIHFYQQVLQLVEKENEVHDAHLLQQYNRLDDHEGA